ncbi:LLM class flavin-dependent oxidoreductase [Paractinoplanes ferrugineus]|uniref:Monooxygenase n=1 Tax=Paractinoplanes ferrugineus TaxID=113564 RepID=A0A919MDL5_9ACTN|nr:LLM class flavin-dependent oxidoreductase [Actinoplanes ferrugineus]GIE08640.1 monooxygenase [Actinoplanes ferrugineus]
MGRLEFGWKASQQHFTIGEYRELWTVVDESGFDSCWVFDHLRPMGRDRTGDIFEAWTILAAMAQATRRVRLGTLVTGNGYRHPALLAKMAATVDHLSGGRLDVGLGAGGDPEADAMVGLPVAAPRERVERLDEAAAVLRLLWDTPVADFAGKHYQLAGAVADPKPVQRPLPLWIASNGERLGLRVVAQRADGWLTATFDDEPGDLGRLMAVLDRHCDQAGRDPAGLRRGVQFPVGEDADRTLRAAARFAAAGFTDLVLMPRGGRVEQVAELLPRLRELG